MRADDGRARLVHCPFCGAVPGQPCVNLATRAQFVSLVHRERIREANK